jgi:hypothetical protein
MQARRKIKVQLSFFSRLLIIVFSGLTMWALTRIRVASTPNTTIALPALFGQLELCASISIASILPCFRILFQSSEKLPIGRSAFPGDDIKVPDSYTMGSTVTTDTSTGGPSPRRAEHSATSSQDVGGAHRSSSGARISDSSFVPSAHTNVSQRPFAV